MIVILFVVLMLFFEDIDIRQLPNHHRREDLLHLEILILGVWSIKVLNG